MSPKDDKTDQAIGHLVREGFKSRLVVGLICLSLGGGSSTIIDKLYPQNKDPRIDTIMVAMQEIKPRLAAIQPLQDTVEVHGNEIAEIKADNVRLAYLAPRKRSVGRGYER